VLFVRALAERFSRGRVLKRQLPARFGGAPIFVSPDAALRFWRKDLAKCDPPLFDAADELVRPGDVVWDVGANVGLFTFAAAARAGATGRVLAVGRRCNFTDVPPHPRQRSSELTRDRATVASWLGGGVMSP
jgi:hypothetical protein